jgi:hypothetical protein
MGDASGVAAVNDNTGGARRDEEACSDPEAAEKVVSLGGGGDGVRARSELNFGLPSRREALLFVFGLSLPTEGFKIPFELLAPWLSDMLAIEMAESIARGIWDCVALPTAAAR